MKRKKVLFICTGNSCRSQMAEAIVNERLGEQWQASSAGTKPVGYVHPLALRTLREIGIQHTGFSKSVTDFISEEIDLVVTVCNSAVEECPVWLSPGKTVHLGFLDPAQTKGSEALVMNAFREVRDEILDQVTQLLGIYA